MNELLLSEINSERIDLLQMISLIEQELFSQEENKTPIDLSAVNELISFCQLEIEGIDDALERAERLIELLFIDNLFIDITRNTWPVNSHCLEHALNFRCFAPALKTLLIIHIVRCCGFEINAVYVPDEVMLRIICDDDYAIIFDVQTGCPINWLELDQRINNLEGSEEEQNLAAIDDKKLIVQYFVSLKTSLIREKQFNLALKCVDFILALNPDDPYHRRDRGFLLQQLDCYKVAFDDFRYFVERCPKDPAAKLLQQQLDMISHIETKLH
ncbi:tetratricopeptide repeat protein [Thalassomonas sp. M1454]|uniref:tetratricopeptide repeat protein n=1 Tax=Thalassomonas sp. M1454 TaxID=2594477 RepID=UPI00117F6832|nr:tetratricopeptide repeat protein [Thalassomonas sp. M1454]TRX57081.1 tetratricopeptide repeat protein [Thalassomonas sp. M1454]